MRTRWDELDHGIAAFDAEFAAMARADERALRLTGIPGIGALNATALVAAVGNAATFGKGRDLAAWLGLVPRQVTTGGRPKLMGITKRGSRYLRKMLIQGARSAMLSLAKSDTAIGSWLRALLTRSHPNVAVVALAANHLVEARVRLDNMIRGLCATFGFKPGPGQGRVFIDRVMEAANIHGLGQSIPGVGVQTSAAFAAAVDEADRFRQSRTAGAYFGLVPRRHQSGEVDWTGRITKQGDGMVRKLLYEAANSILTRSRGSFALKGWAMKIAKRRGLRKARVALARRLAVIMHAMLRDGTLFEA